jgi:septal ring factor EnvC (AmiA/AmiB activator)
MLTATSPDMIRYHLTALLLLPLFGWCDDSQSLLREELRDSIQRQQAELASRAEELSDQASTAAALLETQQRYIDMLEAQIRALQDRDDRPD